MTYSHRRAVYPPRHVRPYLGWLVKVAFVGASGTGKSTLARALQEIVGAGVLPLTPVGSRSTAYSMGFVNGNDEGDPYAVDRAMKLRTTRRTTGTR